MLIRTVKYNAEQQLINDLYEDRVISQSVLQLKLSIIGKKAEELILLSKLKDLISDDKNGRIYLCDDGDVFIVWKGANVQLLADIKNSLVSLVSDTYGHSTEKFFTFYDFQANKEDLRIECQRKIIVIQNKESGHVTTSLNNAAQKSEHEDAIQHDKAADQALHTITQEQIKILKKALENRKNRKNLVILIVEDQTFAYKLLKQILESYECHIASTAQEALNLYCYHAPDIIFQDIELPGGDGHSLVKLYRNFNPESYVIMVTANSYKKDLEMAKINKVNGFIVKPYSKQRIMDCIQEYLKYKKGY